MIRVEGFQKTFRVGFFARKVQAVHHVDLAVDPGEIFGFLGPNGAGKTTTIKALLGLIRADAGTLTLVGHPVDSLAWRSKVGYLPEHPTFYDYLTGFEMVTWFGRLAGLGEHEAETQAKRLLDRVGLAPAQDRRLRSYSKGMLQRAGLAQAMMGNPELLVLDEPMTGLDPIGRKEIRELILELKGEGKTIFYSTHILPDVEMTCDRVAIVHEGRTVRSGRLDEIIESTTRGITVEVTELSDDLRTQLQAQFPHGAFRENRFQVEFEELVAARSFAGDAVRRGAQIARFEPHREDLETIFVRSLGETPPEEKAA